MNINDLNENVLREIFSYLTLRERVSLEIVCKKWMAILNLKKLQKSIQIYFNKSYQKSPKIQLCTNKQHRLDKLNDVIFLKPDENGSLVKIDQILSKFVNLKAIYLYSKDLKSLRRNSLLAAFSKHVGKLEHLQVELFEGPFVCKDLQLLYNSWSKRLKCLMILYEYDMGIYLNRKTVMNFFEICPNLEVFYLKSPYLTKQCLDYVPTRLNSLHLFDTDLDSQSLSTLSNLNGNIFKQLKLSNITDENLKEITDSLIGLELLSIGSLQLNDNSYLDHIKSLRNLNQLNFCLDDKQIHDIDKEFTSIIKNCLLIRKAHIKNAILTDQSLQLIPLYWKNLHSFKLYSAFSSNSKITDQSLKKFTNLSHLRLLAIPNYHLSRYLLFQLIDKPQFECLILRELCLFIDKLFDKILLKTSKSKDKSFKLEIKEDDKTCKFFKLKRPSNFLLKHSKCFNFDFY